MESTGLLSTEAGVVWRASVREENSPAKRSSRLVGNSGATENFNQRKLVLEVFGGNPRTLLRREEVLAPSQTRRGDPCSVTELSQFDAKGRMLSLVFDHHVACGAGSSTSVGYEIEVGRRETRIVGFAITSASRDSITSFDIDYRQGRMTVSESAPEDYPPRQPVKRFVPRGLLPLAKHSFMKCLPPLHGRNVSDCRLP